MPEPEEPLPALLRRVATSVEDVVGGEKRLRSLLDAVTAVAANLDLRETLQRIVTSAAELADARYAALGVINRDGEGLQDFITTGLTDEQVRRIGPPPAGHGILGLIITEPRPLRLHDLSQHAEAYGFPPHHPPMTSFLGVPVSVGGRIFGNLYLTQRNGGDDFTDEDERAIVALAAAAGIAIENASLFDRATRRERWLAATAEIQRALQGYVDRGSALDLVSARARDVAGADLALVILEQDDGELRVEAMSGSRDDLQGAVLAHEGALADVVDQGATVHLSQGVQLSGLEEVGSALIVPFTGPAGAGGAMLVGTLDARGHTWAGEDDVQALRGFAAQAALALDRAQAQQDRATLAVLADRDRIARDLHDLVIQRLFATGLQLQAAGRQVAAPELAQRIRSSVADLDDTIRDIRASIFELHRDDATTGLRAQLSDAANAAASTLGFRPHLRLEGPLDTLVAPEVRPHLVAVLVETLSNAARHADASRVDVQVAVVGSGSDRSVLLQVRDDGKGFTPGGRESGLKNIADRAATLGGSLAVESASGEGTAVTWQVPLSGRA